MFIGDWMERGERYYGDATAVVDVAKGAAGRLSYRQLSARANRLAAHLRDAAGVGRGDRVAVLAMNGVEVLDAFFACSKLGAIFVPLNWRAHARENLEVIELITPRALIYGPDFRETAAALLEARAAGASAGDGADAPIISHALALGAPDLPGAVAYGEIVHDAPAPPVASEQVHEDDVACLLFTGGTTGTAKAAQLSHRMIAWNTLNTAIHQIARGDVTITHTPMFHTGALFVYTLPLLVFGGTVVIMQKWTAEDMLDLIERERVTVLFAVPTQFQAMMASPRFASAKLSTLRFLISGGAPMPVPVIHAYRETHGVVFTQGFGMTEFGPAVFSLAPAESERRAGSIGKPNYFIDARIVGEDNTPVPPGELGELVLKGPSACSGYFKNPEASRAAVDAEGWFHTGDLARTDEDGFYYIAGRKKDMFISGGENVYPLEIERVLYEHPAVAQCSVIGVPHEKWGEVGRAVVVCKPGHTASEAELLEHCAQNLARYKVPRAVIFVEALPMSPAGKILKRELIRMYST
ncbi:MAG TPA: long-chain fatty acid--CoA ligase [Kofleriaceae bacterium]|nr:long-chain fatty acid--CoA ligase [Kofleriaceae bacterium]